MFLLAYLMGVYTSSLPGSEPSALGEDDTHPESSEMTESFLTVAVPIGCLPMESEVEVADGLLDRTASSASSSQLRLEHPTA